MQTPRDPVGLAVTRAPPCHRLTEPGETMPAVAAFPLIDGDEITRCPADGRFHAGDVIGARLDADAVARRLFALFLIWIGLLLRGEVMPFVGVVGPDISEFPGQQPQR